MQIVHYKIAKKHPNFGVFFGDFLVNNFDILSLRARKNNFFQQNNVRNVFSNIELPLGYNIVNLDYVHSNTWCEVMILS